MSLSSSPSTLAPAGDARAALLHQISWGAVFAGTVTALVTQLVLNVVGVGVGLSSVDATSAADNPAASTLSLGAGLWWVGSGIVASLAGGYIAGRLSGRPVGGTAALHGLVSWAVTTLVVLYLLTSAVGGIAGGALGTVTNALGGAGSALGSTVQTAAQAAAPSLSKISDKIPDPLAGIESKVREQAAGQDPQALRDAAVGAVRAVLTGDASDQAQAETRAAEALAKAQNVPVDQARQQIQDYRRQYEEAVKTAKQKAEAAAVATKSAATQGAFYAALALLLGALAGFIGGRIGTVSRVG